MQKGDSELMIEGYNTDRTYLHKIRFYFNIVDTEIYFASLGLLHQLEEFISLQRKFLGVDK